jgi:hypothetical protein
MKERKVEWEMNREREEVKRRWFDTPTSLWLIKIWYEEARRKR